MQIFYRFLSITIWSNQILIGCAKMTKNTQVMPKRLPRGKVLFEHAFCITSLSSCRLGNKRGGSRLEREGQRGTEGKRYSDKSHDPFPTSLPFYVGHPSFILEHWVERLVEIFTSAEQNYFGN